MLRGMANIKIALKGAAFLAASAVLVSCGGGPGAQGDSGDQAKYAACLRDQGLTVTERSDGLDIKADSPEKSNAAKSACKQYAPAGEEMSPEDKKQAMDTALKYVACMRRAGVDMPDPKQDPDGGVAVKLPDGMTEDTPVVQQAQQACKEQAPGNSK
ncbi:hypothetical protein D5H75_31040 [Bailinhaonella thermotolerans]|uniref:Secreted protein n=1 Tax=Bailinhaonella thermotolerans TaxID=1070861 RepID=A0A3A4ABM7_9ACTN|nr:hypothetical protein D5H75_31040 [Bailinhaonella thermotolerans]